MDKRNSNRTFRACVAGIANQAVVVNATALLFAPFMRLYGFTYVQLGLLTAAGFFAQMAADISLVFLVDRISRKKLALFAAVLSAAGLLFYGCTPWLFSAENIYGGILAATAVFAFAGGMLEIVLTGVADSLPQAEGRGGICLLHTAYAWAQVALALALLAFVWVFGAERWNFAVLVLALVPLSALLLLARARFPPRQARAPAKASFKPFYLFAVLAVFFGYGTEVVMNQWISSFAAEIGGEAGGMLGCAAFAACLGVGGAVYVFAERRRGKIPLFLLCASALLAAAAYILAALVPSDWIALAFAALCGVFAGMLSPGAMSAASDFLPRSGGWMLASLAVAQDIGAAALPSAAGALSQGSSVRSAFFAMSAAPLLAAAALFAMAKLRGSGGKGK